MQPRERMLALAVGGLLVLLGARFVWQRVSAAIETRESRLTVLQTEVAGKQAQIARGQRARKDLKAWREQSLPGDAELASSLYQSWLLALAESVKLGEANLDTNKSSQRRGVYQALPFTVRGQGTLDQLTQFLFQFYRQDHLHQILSVTAKPLEDKSKLDLTIKVEALVLPGASRAAKLRDEPANKLAQAELAAYQKEIVERNVLARYTPPPPSSEPPKVEPTPLPFDTAKFAFVTAILEGDGQTQVCIQMRTEGKSLYLREGEEFQAGAFAGRVLTIRRLDVTIESEGKRRRVELGKSLSEGIDLPAEAGVTAQPTQAASGGR
jgi:Tfp pilus assembly protein PilO